jgi:hypothetical protein
VLRSRIIFFAAPAPASAPGENFDAAPALAAPALAPTLLYSKAKFLKLTKVYTHVETILLLFAMRAHTVQKGRNLNLSY